MAQSETGQTFDRRMLAHRQAASGQWDRVLATARDWLAQEPENPVAHRYAAQALVNLHRHADAETHLQLVLASNPRDDFAHRMMSMVQFELGAFAAADESIQQAIALDPEDANNWYHLAHMAYRQKDLASGLKWAARARELAPTDADILNLYTLCSGDTTNQEPLLKEVLSLDPENAYAHNNLGVFYLNAEKNYVRAEECFRRALEINPGVKIARKNLFHALKHRDLVYRILRAPLDMFLGIRSALAGRKGRNVLAAIGGFILWLLVFRFVLAGVILWCAFIWPMLKVYEFLIIGDIRSKAGEAGARRGGFLRYRQWPVRLRLTLFGVLLAGFWSVLYFVYSGQPAVSDEARQIAMGTIMSVVLLAALAIYSRRGFKHMKSRYHSWRRQRRLKHLADSPT